MKSRSAGPGTLSVWFLLCSAQTDSALLALPPGAAGQNKQHSITKNTAKLDRETEELHHDRVTLEVGKVIQRGRQSKGLTQKDLATVRLLQLWSGDRRQVLRQYREGGLTAQLWDLTLAHPKSSGKARPEKTRLYGGTRDPKMAACGYLAWILQHILLS